MENTVYLKGAHEGWIINLLEDGIEVISPAVGELEVVQTCGNVVVIVEKPNAPHEPAREKGSHS